MTEKYTEFEKAKERAEYLLQHGHRKVELTATPCAAGVKLESTDVYTPHVNDRWYVTFDIL